MDVKILDINIPPVGTGAGYGISFKDSSPVVVGTVSPESVADRGGLKYGDYMVEVNGNRVRGLNKGAVITLIKSSNRGSLKVKVGRVRPIPIATKDKEMAVRILEDKLTGVEVSSSEVKKYEATLKNSLLEVEDLLGTFDLSSFNQPAKTAPTRTAPTNTAPTKSTSAKSSKPADSVQEFEVALYDSDSLPSPPSSDESDVDPTDKLLDFSLDDEFSYNPTYNRPKAVAPQPPPPDHSRAGQGDDDDFEAPRMMKAMLRAKHGVEGMKEIIRDVTDAKKRKEEEAKKSSQREVTSTFEPSLRRPPSERSSYESGRPSSDNTTKSGRPLYNKSERPSSDNTTKPGRPSSDNTAKYGRPSSDNTTKSGRPSLDNTTKPGRPSSDNTTKSGRPSLDNTAKSERPSSDNTAKPGRPSSDVTKRPSYDNTAAKSERPWYENSNYPEGRSPKNTSAPSSFTRTHPASPTSSSPPSSPHTPITTSSSTPTSSHPLSHGKKAIKRAPSSESQRTQTSQGISNGAGYLLRETSVPLLPRSGNQGREMEQEAKRRSGGGESSNYRRTAASPPSAPPTSKEESSKYRRTAASPPPAPPTSKEESSKYRRTAASPPPAPPTSKEESSKYRRTAASPPPAPPTSKEESSKYRRTAASPPPAPPTSKEESSKYRRTAASPPPAPPTSKEESSKKSKFFSRLRRSSASPPSDTPPRQEVGVSPPPPQVPSYNPPLPDQFPLSNKKEYREEYNKQRHSYEDIKPSRRSKSRSPASPPPSEATVGAVSPQDVPHRRKKKKREEQNGILVIGNNAEREFVGEGRVSGGRGKLRVQSQEEVKISEVEDVANLEVACDGLPRSVYEWQHEEVYQWLRQLSPSLYKLYKTNFARHDIIGRTLIRLNRNRMKSMGITDPKHSRILAMEVTRLKVHQEKMELQELQEEKELSFL